MSRKLMTAIEQALADAGVSPAFIMAMVLAKRKVSCQPVFIRGEMEYAVYVSGNPDHILGLFRSKKLMRAFIKHFQLEIDFDGVFG